LLITAVLLMAPAGGCGGGSSSSSSSADTASSSGDSSSSSDSSSSGDASSPADLTQSETGASAEFIRPGKKNTIAEFGEEAEAAEREEASSVLEENLQARATGDWTTQCSTLTAATVKLIEKRAPALTTGGCPAGLEALAQPVAKSKPLRANNMTGPIAVLRVEGNKGFALYHGTNETDYTMPLRKEDGEWKVAALVTQEIP
jgi:hypothetical protein